MVIDVAIADDTVTGGLLVQEGVLHYRIDGVEQMRPFLMTVVSDSDLWMFVSSTGALTAGRGDADHALFPYETDDRLHRAAGLSGPVTVIARFVDGVREVWRPFDREPTPGCRRAVAKSALGDRLVFEERHPRWALRCTVTWAPSDRFGWVRTVQLTNESGSTAEYEVLDGLLDVMPAGVDAHTEQIRSNLVDAYKRSETGPWGTLAVFSLEALITDRAEPAEALSANVVWSSGFAGSVITLDGDALHDMLAGRTPQASHLVTGRPGAYLLSGMVDVSASGSVTWTIVADTGLDSAAVLATSRVADVPDAIDEVILDIERGSTRLASLLEGADSSQVTADPVADAHHLSNVLFNSMRGGIFPHGHQVPIADLADFVGARNRPVLEQHRTWFELFGSSIDVADLRGAALATGDPDLIRLVLEYLPLTFSRRHGDPSRPWNRFSITVRGDDGGQLLAYEGNWRDIFQNWEALLYSYPAYFGHVVAKFVNASTIDGYNPYRISRAGIDWEVPDPDDPWSHIGYWGDHQIVYLLRLLEAWQAFRPDGIAEWLDRPVFVYADVPYAIAAHDDIVRDPRNTISFDVERAAEIAERERRVGADGRLVVGAERALLRVGLIEKLLVPALAKITNFVPEGGIWLNTQRPEWNDANNALAGPGISMVTLYHLRRYLAFLDTLLVDVQTSTVQMTASVAQWLADQLDVLEEYRSATAPIGDRDRRRIVDALGRAGEAHRGRVRARVGISAIDVPIADVRRLCAVAGDHLDRAIGSGRRDDGLYHSYNRVSFPTDEAAEVDHLGAMLEGQVAVLSSGALGAAEVVAVVDSLFESEMYRADQDTFMLYPVKHLRSFLDRNVVPDDLAHQLRALGAVNGALDRILVADADDRLHFGADLINAKALDVALDQTGLDDADRALVHQVYEHVFDHRSFTGRSGSMYGYEGIGSVYWHMVAKLLVAVQENYWVAVDRDEPDEVIVRLAGAYRRIRAGLGFRKSPLTYGAIPTDCYSHTPSHAGAQQPGMTGQVKEEVLARFGELGLRVVGGRVALAPGLLGPDEVFPTGRAGSDPARFTFCAVAMTIARGDADSVELVRPDGRREHGAALLLTREQSHDVFSRAGTVDRVDWTIGESTMRRWTRLHDRITY